MKVGQFAATVLSAAAAIIALVAFVVGLAGCSLLPTRTVVKTETVEVTKHERAALPAKLVQPCTYVEPDPLCWRDGHREFCDEQLLEMRLGYRHALGQCDQDKTGLRALGPVSNDGG